MSITLEKRPLTFEEYLNAVRTQEYSSTEEIPVDKEVVIRLNTIDIAILSFVICVVLSLIFALIYKAFFAEPSSREKILNNNDNGSYMGTEFSKNLSSQF